GGGRGGGGGGRVGRRAPRRGHRLAPGPAGGVWMTTVERATAAAGTVATDERGVGLPAEGEVTFGRSPNAALRIGHVPVYDDVVPRMAGRMLSCAGRVLVENLDETLAFDLRVTGRPLVTVPPGEVHGPRDRAFDILVAGTF